MRLPVEWITELAPVEASAPEIAHALTMAGLEVEATEQTDHGTVLDIKVTPNRGDCLSVIGVARELAAVYGVALRLPAGIRSSEDEPPDAAAFTAVEIEDPALCPRYAARIVEGIQHGPSPEWMQERLLAAGMRPISAIVDITNYVMLEMGQPLHAFDYHTLRERRIVVRRARQGETLTTLDGVARDLTPEALVIADAERPVALAGVMGGADTEITENTTVMLLESAQFDWRSIRRTSKRLGLTTEASYRFERIVDPAGVVVAADRVCALLEQLGIGSPVAGVVDEYPAPPQTRCLSLRPVRVSRLLGYDVSAEEVTGSLSRLGFGVKDSNGGTLSVTVPTWRPDIQREVDLVEEVGRVLGYDRIPEGLPVGATTQGADSEIAGLAEVLRDRLVGAGLQEVVTHSLMAVSPFDDPATAHERIAIRSALSEELSGLRRSLVPGLLDVLDRNARRGQAPLAFFEIGRIFVARGEAHHDETLAVGGAVSGPISPRSWHASGPAPVPFFVVRGLVDAVLGASRCAYRVVRSSDARLHPGRQAAVIVEGRSVGVVGELHPELAERLHVRDRIGIFELNCGELLRVWSSGRAFVGLSPYPAVMRDIAPRVPSSVPYADVLQIVRDAGGPILEDASLVDVFMGQPLPEGVRSLTLSLTLRASDRTLTDAEAERTLEAIRTSLKQNCGAEFPGT